MVEYLDEVIIPCVVETRKELELADDHPASAIFDIFAVHCCSDVLAKLSSNHIR